MMTIKQIALTLALISLSALLVSAQAQTARISTVNITGEADKVHVSVQGDVSEMRVDVSDEEGDFVFQSGTITGGTLDWKMTDAQGERVKAGTYLVTVTFRMASGKLRKRVEQVRVEEAEQASTQAPAAPAATPPSVSVKTSGTVTAGRIPKIASVGATSATITNSVITESASKIGIGTAAPAALLHVITSDVKNPAITGRNNAKAGIGVFGYAPDGFAVVGQSSTKTGVLGTSSSGGGVVGTSANGSGVIGESGSGVGIQGFSNSNTGIVGQTNSGTGVLGLSISNGYGVRGQSANNTGVSGESRTGYGVIGLSTSGSGVRGVSVDEIGVFGASQSYVGIYGKTRNASSYAGLFDGNVRVNGTLSKTAGSFKIDHPLDPANKYLYHSFVESPDMMNIYNGIVTLDRKGQAVVVMPSYFNALNKDFRYQLTPIGAAAPRLYIAEEITANRFKIAGGRPGIKVSWQVTGIRHDAYAEAHRIRVEEEKSAAERGTYLHPELFGQPEDRGVEQASRATQTQPRAQLNQVERTMKGRRTMRRR